LLTPPACHAEARDAGKDAEEIERHDPDTGKASLKLAEPDWNFHDPAFVIRPTRASA